MKTESALMNLFRQLDALAPYGATSDNIPLPFKPGEPVVLIALAPPWYSAIVEPGGPQQIGEDNDV